ncbi:MAG: hypothetical protein ACRDF4_10760, partial [Rhabdochlamydiaceae bacterium]
FASYDFDIDPNDSIEFIIHGDETNTPFAYGLVTKTQTSTLADVENEIHANPARFGCDSVAQEDTFMDRMRRGWTPSVLRLIDFKVFVPLDVRK